MEALINLIFFLIAINTSGYETSASVPEYEDKQRMSRDKLIASCQSRKDRSVFGGLAFNLWSCLEAGFCCEKRCSLMQFVSWFMCENIGTVKQEMEMSAL